MVVPCPLGLWTCNRCDAELSARSCGGNDPPTDRHLGFSTLGEFLQISHLFVASISEFLPGFASRVFLVQLESWQHDSGAFTGRKSIEKGAASVSEWSSTVIYWCCVFWFPSDSTAVYCSWIARARAATTIDDRFL